jgi:zinc protease
VVGVTRPGSEQTTIARGQLAIPRAHPDLHALRLANHALGGSSSGRLFTRLREELGLTYGVSSSVDAGLVGGDFSLSFTTAAARTAEACQALSASLGDFSTRPPAGEELERARRSMIGGYVHGTVGVAAVAGLLARGRVLGIDRADLAERPARIAALDDEAVQQAAARWITPADQSLVLVGVAEALDAALADEPDALRVDAEDTAYHRGDFIP